VVSPASMGIGPSGQTWVMSTFAATMLVEFLIPGCTNLKAKRSVVKPIVEGARHRFQVAAAEVDHQDVWARSAVAFSVVTSAAHLTDEVLDDIERFVWSQPGIEVVFARRAWIDSLDFDS
jgi:uncharacterized protein